MEQTHLFRVEEGNEAPTPIYALNASERVLKKVSKQLAKPNVAGFQARLDREDFNACLKHVSNEKIDVLLDEFMVEVRVLNGTNSSELRLLASKEAAKLGHHHPMNAAREAKKPTELFVPEFCARHALCEWQTPSSLILKTFY